MPDPMSEAEFRRIRGVLRMGGPVLTGIGVVLFVIGIVDFFASAGSFGGPRRFWMVMLGLPMLGVGLAMLRLGYIGKFARYYGRAIGPAASRTFNEVARGSRPGFGAIARAFAGDGASADEDRICGACGEVNRAGSVFCRGCGERLPEAGVCGACGNRMDTEARFCDRCGADL